MKLIDRVVISIMNMTVLLFVISSPDIPDGESITIGYLGGLAFGLFWHFLARENKQ